MPTKKDVVWLKKLKKILEENQDMRPDADLLFAIYSGLQENIKRNNKELIKEILEAIDYESCGQTRSITNVLRREYDVEIE